MFVTINARRVLVTLRAIRWIGSVICALDAVLSKKRLPGDKMFRNLCIGGVERESRQLGRARG
jgi:hypothetical protein